MSDLIRREEAIEWVKNILATHLYYHPHSKSKNVPIDEVIDRLERVPSVEPPKGRWIPKWHMLYHRELLSCSECLHFTIMRSNYCPNCGARMDGDTDG